MRVLLFEPDHRSHRNLSQRLDKFDLQTILASTIPEALAAIEASSFTIAICVWSDESVKICGQLRARCRSLVSITDDLDCEIENQIYAAGFDDVWTSQSVDAAIATKIEHARQLDKLHLRLAQAQKLESIGELAASIAHEINTPIQYVGDNTRFVQDAFHELSAVLRCCQTVNGTAFEDPSFDYLRKVGFADRFDAWASLVATELPA